MTTRTFAPDTYHAAMDAWAEGEFSAEWRDLRHVMAMQGCIFPPAGSKWDGWEDDAPSQRAILVRAIRETPKLLARCARGATSWHQLITRLLAERDDWRAEMRRAEPEPDPEERARFRGAPQSLASILARLADSAGVPVTPVTRQEEPRHG